MAISSLMPVPAAVLALENPDAFFLSQSGECFHNVTVTGGKQRSQGPLSMKRELREVLQQMGEMERAMADEELRVAALGREISELTGLLHRLEDEKRESERQAMTSDHTLRQLEAEMMRVRERLSTYERELERVGEERSQQQTFIAEQSSELSAQKKSSASLKPRCRMRRAAWKACASAATRRPISPAKFARTSPLWKNAAAERCYRAAHRSDGVGGFRASGQVEVATRIGGRREAAARSRERSSRRTGGRLDRRARARAQLAIANCKTNCRPSESALSSWKRR